MVFVFSNVLLLFAADQPLVSTEQNKSTVLISSTAQLNLKSREVIQEATPFDPNEGWFYKIRNEEIRKTRRLTCQIIVGLGIFTILSVSGLIYSLCYFFPDLCIPLPDDHPLIKYNF